MNTRTMFIVAASVAIMITGCESLDKGALAGGGLAATSAAKKGDKKTQAAVAAGATTAAIATASNRPTPKSAQSIEGGRSEPTSKQVSPSVGDEELRFLKIEKQRLEEEEKAEKARQKELAEYEARKADEKKLKMLYKDGTEGTVKWKIGNDTICTSVLFSEQYYNHGSVLMLYYTEGEGSGLFRHEVLFRSMDDLEYALNQVSNYLAKATAWQTTAVEKDVVDMIKDDDKTRVILDKKGKRIENFTFRTRRVSDGKIGCSIYVKVVEEDSDLGRFRNFVMDGSVDTYKKHIEMAFKAVSQFKAEVKRLEEEEKKRKETANLFN